MYDYIAQLFAMFVYYMHCSIEIQHLWMLAIKATIFCTYPMHYNWAESAS